MTDSYIGFTLKIEFVTKNTIYGKDSRAALDRKAGKSLIYGLKMMVKSGLEKFVL